GRPGPELPLCLRPRSLDSCDSIGATQRGCCPQRVAPPTYLPFGCVPLSRPQSRPRAGDFDDTTLSLVREANLFDIQIYHHARTLFEKQFKEMIDAEQNLVRK